MKVRAGSTYVYHPVGMDIYAPAHTGVLVDGQLVKVVALHGCPPPNTMGCCHVELDGKFAGMVLTASLSKE